MRRFFGNMQVLCKEREEKFCGRVNKTQKSTYNNVVEEIIISENVADTAFITYLYNGLLDVVTAAGGREELVFPEGRAAVILTTEKSDRWVEDSLRERIAEIIAIGYKYRFLSAKLNACLSAREKRLLCAALIAADLESDKAFIRRKVELATEYCIDGIYAFRMGVLRSKWEKILSYIPEAFSSADLKKFCDYLVGESRRKIYVKGNCVFGEDFSPLKRSRLLGEEDLETEIMLSDAGYVYCLGDVEDSVGDFLQKYYAERAVFS